MSTIIDLIWRIRCAYHFFNQLGFGWLGHCWYLSGVSLECERENKRRFGDEYETPRDAVREELSCWSE